MSHSVGETVVLDGIESVIIYDVGSEQSWGRYLCVDKSHDLSYYIRGIDEVDSGSTTDSSTTPLPEWGGYETVTGITSQYIGDGLSNTNSLISMKLEPNTSGWPVLWDWVEQFRSNYSNDWFVPTYQELQQVYYQKNYLKNLSTLHNTYYWTSSEYDSDTAYSVFFYGGPSDYNTYKNTHYARCRLCRYTTNLELDSKTIQITCSTPSSQIYYTIDNSTPSQNSNLYSNTFQVQTGTTIKAIGIKEGYIDSDIATLTV